MSEAPNPHLVDGDFQSDKYPTTPLGKVPLSTKDPMAQDLLAEYARRRRVVDAQFSDALECALLAKGYVPGRLSHEYILPDDTIIDYGSGHTGPLFLHYATEGCNYVEIAKEAGFDIMLVGMDEDLPETDQLRVDYEEYGASPDDILPKWQPKEQGDGWKLVGKHDTEDGPVAMFVRPLKPTS